MCYVTRMMQVGATVGSGLELAQSTADTLRDLSAVSRTAAATVNRIRTLLPVVSLNSPPSPPSADDPQAAAAEAEGGEGSPPDPRGPVGAAVGWTGRMLRPFAADGKRKASPERPAVRPPPPIPRKYPYVESPNPNPNPNTACSDSGLLGS